MTQAHKGPKKLRQQTELEIPLSPKEKASLERESFQLLQSIKSLQAQRRKMLKGYTAEIRAKEKLMHKNLEDIEQGFQRRVVEANVVINYTKGIVQFFFEGICRKAMNVSDFKTQQPRNTNVSDERQLELTAGHKGA